MDIALIYHHTLHGTALQSAAETTLGVRARSLHTPAQARSELASRRYDAIIIDPRITAENDPHSALQTDSLYMNAGLRLLGRIRAEHNHRNLPILAIGMPREDTPEGKRLSQIVKAAGADAYKSPHGNTKGDAYKEIINKALALHAPIS